MADQEFDLLPIQPSSSRPAEMFVTLDDAAMLLAVTPIRLRTLVKQGTIPYRGGAQDPMIAVSAINSILSNNDLESATNGAEVHDRPEPATVGAQESDRIFANFETNRIVVGNVLDVVREMPQACVQAIVTSPPFWGQRVYEDETSVTWRDGTDEVFGREPTPEGYVSHTREILGELSRVLKPRGTIWWNLGDTYMTRTIMRSSSKDRIEHYGGKRTGWAGNPNRRVSSGHPNLKDKDLTLVPFLVGLAAQDVGYWVRSVIIWSKQRAVDDSDHRPQDGDENAGQIETPGGAHMPEVVADRPVTGHEYILLLAKESQYDYDVQGLGPSEGTRRVNVRSVWTFPPVGKQGNHGARFPDELPRRCILLGSKVGDLIFDPFAGQGTTLRVAQSLGRKFFGCDISPRYVEAAMAELSRQETVESKERPQEQPATSRLF